MRKLVLGVAAAAFVVLGGCATTSTADIVSEVQNITTAVCSFVPTADTIVAIAGSSPALTTAAAVAQAICAAVTPKAASPRRATLPSVNGIVIHGSFVKQPQWSASGGCAVRALDRLRSRSAPHLGSSQAAGQAAP